MLCRLYVRCLGLPVSYAVRCGPPPQIICFMLHDRFRSRPEFSFSCCMAAVTAASGRYPFHLLHNRIRGRCPDHHLFAVCPLPGVCLKAPESRDIGISLYNKKRSSHNFTHHKLLRQVRRLLRPELESAPAPLNISDDFLLKINLYMYYALRCISETSPGRAAGSCMTKSQTDTPHRG